MKIEFSLEEGRVLNQLTDRVMKDKKLAEQIFAGYQDDINLLSGIAGKVRATYEMEKRAQIMLDYPSPKKLEKTICEVTLWAFGNLFPPEGGAVLKVGRL